ncbi:MAG: pentapeptide repeat-containing protein [bacterium]|nr:pentapeptide repeat-containing protein [bacterium]
MKHFLLLFFVAALLFAIQGEAHAFSCKRPDSKLKDTPYVFKGEVIETKSVPEDIPAEEIARMKSEFPGDEKTYNLWSGSAKITRLKIITAYKGVDVQEITLHHRSGGSLFGASFELAKTYIVYATKDDNGHYTASDSCDGIYNTATARDTNHYHQELMAYGAQTEALQKLIADDPKNPFLHISLGAIHAEYRDYARAEKDYEQAIRLFWRPNEPNKEETPLDEIIHSATLNQTGLRSAYGSALYFQGKYEQAERALRGESRTESRQMYKASHLMLKNYDTVATLAYGLDGIEIKTLDLSGAHADGLDLSGVKIGELILLNTKISNSNFRHAEIRNISVQDSLLSHVDFSKATISGSVVSSADFKDANFTDAKIYISDIERVDFSRANFQGAEMTIYHRLTNSHFDGANLSDFDLSPSEWQQSRSSATDAAFEATFKDALYNSGTKWFTDFDPVKAGAKKSPAK